MRMLCVACDEAMTLTETHGPDAGSMTVVFACPACGREVAMLTNAMETQMVRALGVKIGGSTVPARPMEAVLTSLTNGGPEAVGVAASAPAEPARAGGKCPFTGMVNEAFAQQSGIRWTPEAEARLERIPPSVRSMVRKSIEQQAIDQGRHEIDVAVMDALRGEMGM